MSAAPAPTQISDFSRRVITWQRRHGRHDLPWQQDPTPYPVWISEIMLQQTQVATAIGYFERFMQAFPDLPTLASADLDRVLALWSGLGYYSRARNLHACAGKCAAQHGGELPDNLEELVALPGIGPSTAGAILSLGHGKRGVILDGNVKRVLARHQAIAGWPGKSAVARELWALAEALTPDSDCDVYNQGLMDLGATVCLPRRPRCESCPLNTDCQAKHAGNPEAYPGKKPRKELPIRHTHLLLIRDGDQLLMQRRPPSGIWGGLWSLPEAEYADDLAGTRLPEIVHSFTHFKLRMTPIEVAEQPVRYLDSVNDADLQWQGTAQLQQLGMPAPIRKFLGAWSAHLDG